MIIHLLSEDLLYLNSLQATVEVMDCTHTCILSIMLLMIWYAFLREKNLSTNSYRMEQFGLILFLFIFCTENVSWQGLSWKSKIPLLLLWTLDRWSYSLEGKTRWDQLFSSSWHLSLNLIMVYKSRLLTRLLACETTGRSRSKSTTTHIWHCFDFACRWSSAFPSDFCGKFSLSRFWSSKTISKTAKMIGEVTCTFYRFLPLFFPSCCQDFSSVQQTRRVLPSQGIQRHCWLSIPIHWCSPDPLG